MAYLTGLPDPVQSFARLVNQGQRQLRTVLVITGANDLKLGRNSRAECNTRGSTSCWSPRHFRLGRIQIQCKGPSLLYKWRYLVLACLGFITHSFVESLYHTGRIQGLLEVFIAVAAKNHRKNKKDQENDRQNSRHNTCYSQCLYHIGL